MVSMGAYIMTHDVRYFFRSERGAQEARRPRLPSPLPARARCPPRGDMCLLRKKQVGKHGSKQADKHIIGCFTPDRNTLSSMFNQLLFQRSQSVYFHFVGK